MASNGNVSWLEFISWVLSNPEKSALGLVMVFGTWRWIKEFRSESKKETTFKSYTEHLIKENRDLRKELDETRLKLRKATHIEDSKNEQTR